MIENPIERCAVLAMSIGEEAAAEVFKYMAASEVQAIGQAMVKIRQVTRAEISEVLEAFRQEAEQFTAVSLGSEDYIRSVLNQALGPERAASILDDILEPESNVGIDALNGLEPPAIVEIIGNEHPQIIATIIVHLSRDRASDVLALLPERLRNDVMWRVATFGGVQPAALSALTDVLNNVLSGQMSKRSKLGGARTAAEILNTMKAAEEAGVLSDLRERDADLAQRVEDEMFVFTNLEQVEDASIQVLMAEIDTNSLTLALKGAPDSLVEKFLSNMSVRQGEMIRDDLSDKRPVRLSTVEAERKAIVQAARHLADEGRINLKAMGDDEYV